MRDIYEQADLDAKLLKACEDRNIPLAKKLIEQGADVNATDGEYWTPMLIAIDNGHMGLLELLVANGADVDARDSDGLTPLHCVAGYCDENTREIAQLLLFNGADLGIVNCNGNTPKKTAEHYGNDCVLEVINEHFSRMEALELEKHLDASIAKKTQGTQILPQSI